LNQFNQLRPDFKTIQDDLVEKEINPIDSKDIKMETIDFNYVPVRGWRSEDNSIYGMSVVADNIRFAEPFINHSGAFEVERLGYMEPLRTEYVAPISKEEQNKPVVDGMVLPMLNSEDLQWDIPFINQEPSLNYDTKPAQNEDANMFWSSLKNSIYIPDEAQMAFEDPTPSKTPEKEFSTEPKPSKIIDSGVGIGNGNTFDAVGNGN